MPEDTRKANPLANSDANAPVPAPLANLGKIIALLILVAFGLVYFTERSRAHPRVTMPQKTDGFDSRIDGNALPVSEDGKQIFRYDTFGDEAFWGERLKLHRAIEGTKLGGVGPGVSPKTALSVGLKVDMDALPADLVDKIKRGQVNLDDPATTLALIKLNSVLGIMGQFWRTHNPSHRHHLMRSSQWASKPQKAESSVLTVPSGCLIQSDVSKARVERAGTCLIKKVSPPSSFPLPDRNKIVPHQIRVAAVRIEDLCRQPTIKGASKKRLPKFEPLRIIGWPGLSPFEARAGDLECDCIRFLARV